MQATVKAEPIVPDGKSRIDGPLVRRPIAYALAAAAGGLYFAAFPGTDLWPCAFVAYAPLIVALEGQPAPRALAMGFVAGLIMNVLGLYWLFPTIRKFSGLGTPISGLLSVALCAYQGLRIGLFGWLYARARHRGWPLLGTLLCAFVTSELVYPLIFPWFFGACAHRVPSLMQWAAMGGPILVGLILLAPSAALGHAAVRWLRGQGVRRDLVALGLGIPVAAALVGRAEIWRVDRMVRQATPVHVGVAQANLEPPSLLRRVGRVHDELRLTDQLRQKGVDFVVWSETVVLGVPSQAAESYLQTFFSRRLGVPSLIGAVLVRGEGSERRLVNSALALKADGRIAGQYDKHLLFPVGESLPLFDTFPGLYRWLPHAMNFAAGQSFQPLLVAGHPVAALICYEDLFPGFVNDAVNATHPEMLVNLTNDAWFGDTTEPWMHLALAKFRAVEHRRYLIRATNTGVSAIIDPVGRTVVRGGTFREEAIDGVAHWMKPRRTVYEVLGNGPWWMFVAGAALMAFRRRRIG
ncbi:MAG: apolipoprotein N-acyltransferase [Pseudomonadota bacterium]